MTVFTDSMAVLDEMTEEGYIVVGIDRRQFANFVAEVWNSEYWKKAALSDISFWQIIAAKEFSREFQEGWGYCESRLWFSPNEGRNWLYATTSGTILAAHQGSWVDENGVGEICFKVAIPVNREGGRHHKMLSYYQENAEAEFFSWATLFYAKEGTPEYAEARRRGMTIELDPEVQQRKTERKAMAVLTIDPIADEEYEDFNEDWIEE